MYSSKTAAIMKKQPFYKQWAVGLLSLLALLFAGTACGTTSSISGGLNDESYIVVASSSAYVGKKVFVLVDDVSAVGIVAVRPDAVTRHAKRITITPGRHTVIVRDAEGRTLFSKEIFISSRAAKTITCSNCRFFFATDEVHLYRRRTPTFCGTPLELWLLPRFIFVGRL